MQIYHYNPITFDFIYTGTADESPLEPGVFLVPAHATNIEPPVFDATKQTCRFDGTWQVENIPEPEPEPEPVPPTQDEIIQSLTVALEFHYDTKAREKRYDNRLTCALRAGYTGPFQTEGQTFAIWMDTCNALAYQIMEDVLAGNRAIPTAEELIAEIPELVW